MQDPVKILVKKEELTLAGIKQFMIHMDDERSKLTTLFDLYRTLTINKTMIYANTKDRANWLYNELIKNNFTVAVIHSEMDSNRRAEIIERFRNGAYRISVSTDLLARGIDVQQVSIIINYDVPMNYENYLHRIGRSGRYGRRGLAINFVSPKELHRIKSIEEHYNIIIEVMPQDISEYI